METRQSGKRYLLCGASGSGKTTIALIISELNDRTAAFDIKQEWCMKPGFKVANQRHELLELMRENKGAIKIAYPHFNAKEFDFFCSAAFNFNRQKEALIIAEELAMVTTTAKAKDGWLRIVTQSRGYGATVLAIAQRTQEIDNTIVGNVTGTFLFMMNNEYDAEAAAKKFGIKVEDVPKEEFKFIFVTRKGIVIRDGRTVKDKRTGKIKLMGKKPGSDRMVNLSLNKDGTFKGVDYSKIE